MRNGRSASHPMTTSTSSGLDNNPEDCVVQERRREDYTASTSLTPLHNGAGGGAGGGATLLDNVSLPGTPMSTASYGRPVQQAHPCSLARSSSSGRTSSNSLQHFCQHSHEHYSSYSSSGGSCFSSCSSLPQGNIFDAVVESTSAKLVDRMMAEVYSGNSNYVRRQSGHGGSYHGPHAPTPETFQLQVMGASTLPPRVNPAAVQPAKGPICGPTITEICSEPEEDEKAQLQQNGTLECPANPRKGPPEVKEQNSPRTNSYDDTTLRPKHRGREKGQSRAPRASEQLDPRQAPISEPLQQTAGGQGIDGVTTLMIAGKWGITRTTIVAQGLPQK